MRTSPGPGLGSGIWPATNTSRAGPVSGTKLLSSEKHFSRISVCVPLGRRSYTPPITMNAVLVKQNSIGARSRCRLGLGGGAELPAKLRLLDKHFLTLLNEVLR